MHLLADEERVGEHQRHQQRQRQRGGHHRRRQRAVALAIATRERQPVARAQLDGGGDAPRDHRFAQAGGERHRAVEADGRLQRANEGEEADRRGRLKHRVHDVDPREQHGGGQSEANHRPLWIARFLTTVAKSGVLPRVRIAACVALVTTLAATAAQADDPPKPRRRGWRVRATLMSGFGGSYDHRSVAAFPTTLELGVRIWGPLSFTTGATGVLSGDYYTDCGQPRRANAILGHAGLRVDFNNRKSDSWLDPFVEAHGGIGGQKGNCSSSGLFGSGGVRAGLDVWLGRVAVTVAVAFDWTPIAPPASGYLGATFILK